MIEVGKGELRTEFEQNDGALWARHALYSDTGDLLVDWPWQAITALSYLAVSPVYLVVGRSGLAEMRCEVAISFPKGGADQVK